MLGARQVVDGRVTHLSARRRRLSMCLTNQFVDLGSNPLDELLPGDEAGAAVAEPQRSHRLGTGIEEALREQTVSLNAESHVGLVLVVADVQQTVTRAREEVVAAWP